MSTYLKRLRNRIDRLGKARPHQSPGDNLPFAAWSRYYLPHYFPLPPSPFHAWLTAELDGMQHRRGTMMCVLAPRLAAKSTCSTQSYPLFCASRGTEQYIILTADTHTQAKKYLESIREELESNALLRSHYPEMCRRGKPWRDDAIRLGNGVLIEAAGTGDKIRGRKNRQHRPTLIIADDPENTDHVISKLQRGRSWDWLTKDVQNAGGPETNIIVLGTALHRECMVCRLQHTAGWNTRLWQSVVSWPSRMDLWREWEEHLHDYDKPDAERAAIAREFYERRRREMDAGAVVLWPERESLYDLMLRRASIGAAAFNCEKQNLPVDPSTCEWPPELFEHAAIWFDQWPDEKDFVVKTIGVDPSKGASDKKGDYSAIVMFGRTGSGVEYVEADLARRHPEQICADLVEHVRRFKPDGVALETNQFQELLTIPLQTAATAAGIEVPVYKMVNTVNKLVRIRRLGTPLVEKRLRFKARSPGTMLLYNQMRDFDTGDHDDAPDALELGRRLAIELSKSGKVKGFKR